MGRGKRGSSDPPFEDSGPLEESGSVSGLGDKGTTEGLVWAPWLEGKGEKEGQA